jgi:hypothetical protein
MPSLRHRSRITPLLFARSPRRARLPQREGGREGALVRAGWNKRHVGRERKPLFGADRGASIT